MVDAVTGIGRKAHGKALGLQVCGASPQEPPRCTVSLYAVAGWPLYPGYDASQTATRVLLRRLDMAPY